MEKDLKILIVGSILFPFGSASASRIRTISKGLVENGAHVHIITTAKIPALKENHVANNTYRYKGVTYESTSPTLNDQNKSSRLSRLYDVFASNNKCLQQVKYHIQKENYDAIYIYSRSVILNIPLVWFVKRTNVSIFYDMVEWMPVSAFKKGFINPFYYDDLLGRLLSRIWCDGVIAITSYISKKYLRYKIPCIVVPSVFEFTESYSHKINNNITNQKEFTLLYAGACKSGDGFSRLLKAVKISVKRGCPVKLIVVGTDGKQGRAARYRKLCEKDDGLRDRVSFKGRVPDESYISVLSESTCLVLPRPDVQVVRASFPTRLPEFLSTGRPVLTTSVPDVPLYLKANEEAIIVSGDTAESLAEGIIDIWKNPGRAERIGLSGKKRGQKEFDYLSRSKSIYNFIQKHKNFKSLDN